MLLKQQKGCCVLSERFIAMAKAQKREYIWLECKECGDRNYRTEVNVQGGTPKFELKKFCKRERKRTVHKIRRK
jgi:large subunit ribosomal protein L33